MKKPVILSLIMMCIALGQLAAQEGKAVGKPEKFNRPEDYFDSQNQYELYITNTNPKSKQDAWMVIADREDTPVFKSKGGASAGTIPFRTILYVVKEDGNWVQVKRGKVDKLNIIKGYDVGWVEKKNILLWNSSIVDPVTKIHRKVLLLNKAESIDDVIKKENKDLVKIFSDPDKKKQEPEKRIFEFYFVMKKDKDKDMYLLSKDVNLTPGNIEESLVGWVSGRDCDRWDTRICLEPNFNMDAFQERKDNPRYRIKAFKTSDGVIKYIEGGNVNEKEEVFWTNDPVLVTKDQMATGDPMRFKGSVIRFPMVDLQETKNGSQYFISGMVGSLPVKDNKGRINNIDENAYAQLQKFYQAEEQRSKNVNVFFVVEGTEDLQPYQQKIAQSIQDIENSSGTDINQIRYGALLYRGVAEDEAKRLTEHIPLTPDAKKVIDWISKAQFENRVDRSELRAMYFGLNKALTVGDFRPDDLNVIFIIGCYADFSMDPKNRETYAGKPYLLKAEDIAPQLNKLNVHLHAIQVKNGGYQPWTRFVKQSANLILENAKFDQNEFQKMSSKDQSLLSAIKQYNPGVDYESPELDDAGEDNSLSGGRRRAGRLSKPQRDRELAPEALGPVIKRNLNESLEYSQNMKKILSSLINAGNTGNLEEIGAEVGIRDVGPYTGAFLYYLASIQKDKNVDVQDVLGEKFRLFTKVYFPFNIRGASYPAISFSLFMPESDVREYKRTISRLGAMTDVTSMADKREKIDEVFRDLVSKFTGNKSIRYETLSNQDLRDILQGVHQKGLRPDKPDYFYALADVTNKEKVPDAKINAIIERFKEVEKSFERILRLGGEYEFCYSTDEANRYYWIPFRDAF